MISSGDRVTYSRTSVNVNDVSEALSSADESFLLGIGPFSDGLRNGVIDSSGDGLIVCVLKAERPGVLSGSFDVVYSVIISSACREKKSWGVIETFGGSGPIHHSSHCFVHSRRTGGACGFPGSVRDAARAGSAGFWHA